MNLQLDRRTFLEGLIAAGASFALSSKASKAEVEIVWQNAQANPWFFEVDENGTLVEGQIKEPQVWADVFDIRPDYFRDPVSIISEILDCYPLTSHLDTLFHHEIESLENNLRSMSTESTNDFAALQKKVDALKQTRDDFEEPWQDWIELEGTGGVEYFKQRVSDWLAGPIDWSQAEWIPLRSGPQGRALAFFEQQSPELLDAVGVVIVEGDHPGSSYYAAELRIDVGDANSAVTNLGLPFRFKKS